MDFILLVFNLKLNSDICDKYLKTLRMLDQELKVEPMQMILF